MNDGDRELLARAVGGDAAAREALFARHYLSVLRFFQLNATWVADDLTQRTLVACLEKLASVPAEGFRPYLFGIARNQLRMYVRHAAVAGAHDEPSPQARHTGVSTIVARSQQQRRLLVALGRLPDDQRIAITLHYWEELNSSELGHALGIPASTVRTRLARARERLHAEMVRQGERGEDFESALREIGPRLTSA
ncbi:MAG: RNA polymerase sigma factor [Myxococcota bacterium]